MNVLEIYSPRKSADFVKFPNSDTDFQRSNIPKKPEGGGRIKLKPRPFAFSKRQIDYFLI